MFDRAVVFGPWQEPSSYKRTVIRLLCTLVASDSAYFALSSCYRFVYQVVVPFLAIWGHGDTSVELPPSLETPLFDHFLLVEPVMAGLKRPRNDDDGMTEPQPRVSPFMTMFETFRTELDEHHDRRERIIKASRDITALSKKM